MFCLSVEAGPSNSETFLEHFKHIFARTVFYVDYFDGVYLTFIVRKKDGELLYLLPLVTFPMSVGLLYKVSLD